MNTSIFVFTGILLKEKSSICALCIEVDVATEGVSIDEAKNNLLEAVSLYIETAIESNLPILRPVPSEDNPLINTPNKVVETFTFKINFEVRAYA